jgi:hypothetical protein
MPKLLTCRQQTKRGPKASQVAGFISEWWPASNRNGGRNEIGIPGRLASEFAAERLAAMNLGDDGLLAAAVLMRIAANYERAALEASQLIPVENLNAENDE